MHVPSIGRSTDCQQDDLIAETADCHNSQASKDGEEILEG